MGYWFTDWVIDSPMGLLIHRWVVDSPMGCWFTDGLLIHRLGCWFTDGLLIHRWVVDSRWVIDLPLGCWFTDGLLISCSSGRHLFCGLGVGTSAPWDALVSGGKRFCVMFTNELSPSGATWPVPAQASPGSSYNRMLSFFVNITALQQPKLWVLRKVRGGCNVRRYVWTAVRTPQKTLAKPLVLCYVYGKFWGSTYPL